MDLIILLVLLMLGLGFGSYREKKHFKSIIKREKQYKDILLFDSKRIPEELNATGGEIVQGHVVISVDYFKRFVAGLRKLFGGNLKSYETLLDRGRREAILRMKKDAKNYDADKIFNIKFETASISKGAGKAIGSVEVMVYGSAVKSSQEG